MSFLKYIKFLKTRSDKSCQAHFQRHAAGKQPKAKATEFNNAEVQTEISISPRELYVWGKVSVDQENTSCLRQLLETEPERSSTCPPNKSTIEQPMKSIVDNSSLVTTQPSVSKSDTNRTENDTNLDHCYSTNARKKVKKAHRKKTTPLKVNPLIQKISLLDSMKLKLVSSTLDSSYIARTILRIPVIKDAVVENIAENIGEIPTTMTKRVHGDVSVLMKKDYEALETTDLGEIVDEFQEKFPELFQILIKIMVPRQKRQQNELQQELIPKLAMIYGCMMQSRNPELSRLQRVVSSTLADNICDQKVYDRLNTMGICLSYNRSLTVTKQIGEHFMDLLISAAKAGKYIRFIGDNLNFTVNVNHETQINHKHMVHMFASAALVSEKCFSNRQTTPQIPIDDLSPKHVLLSTDEYAKIRADCIKLFVEVVATYLPNLQFMKKYVPVKIAGPDADLFHHKTEVYPLPVLPFNETSYQDDVKILDHYEDIVKQICQNVNALPNNIKFQIGGDQLTRERFSYAKMLRLGNYEPSARFAHLGPTTFEFFHLGMNYLEKMIFGLLWNAKGALDLGTLKCEKERVIRNSVDPDVMKAYDSDKEFVISFTRAYMIEACMDYFDMEDRNDIPNNLPEESAHEDDKKQWVEKVIGEIVDKYVFPVWSGKEDEIVLKDTSEAAFVQVILSNGSVVNIPIEKSSFQDHKQLKPDKIKDYGHCVLECGLTFMYFLSLMKCPDRDSILGLFKMMMLQLKSKNNLAKYPLEILRMLVQQYSLLPLNEACQTLYACFVNTKGKPDTHIPADLQNEWIVKEEKKHIKHMYSNKTVENIQAKSSALPGISHIGANFDTSAGCVIRCKAHKASDSTSDELKMMDDLRKVRPFKHCEGRAFTEFQNICKSQLDKFDGQKFHAWFYKHKNKFVA